MFVGVFMHIINFVFFFFVSKTAYGNYVNSMYIWGSLLVAVKVARSLLEVEVGEGGR